MDSRKCQTSTASPAEPGGLPCLASFRPLLCVAGLYLVIAAALFVRIPVRVPASDIFDQVAPSIATPAPKTEAQSPAPTLAEPDVSHLPTNVAKPTVEPRE
jgi:hypothetical protein